MGGEGRKKRWDVAVKIGMFASRLVRRASENWREYHEPERAFRATLAGTDRRSAGIM